MKVHSLDSAVQEIRAAGGPELGGDGVGVKRTVAVADGWGGEGVFNYKFVVRYMLNIALALYADELCLRRILETESPCIF